MLPCWSALGWLWQDPTGEQGRGVCREWSSESPAQLKEKGGPFIHQFWLFVFECPLHGYQPLYSPLLTGSRRWGMPAVLPQQNQRTRRQEAKDLKSTYSCLTTVICVSRTSSEVSHILIGYWLFSCSYNVPTFPTKSLVLFIHDLRDLSQGNK